ncbi:bifunctional phosphoribosyl-AMP cyclohydrolase/phosphoribosyl-ATP diphosphatase HisIE [Crassaminicella profunda]|uniref:bifunctional phosphoribosyl-AMP cyclohydrolase/phosphoribosyl-ATP diphosphatase HisIE n=1 Tax=Crassaminicella profunda TaxID=1286698 RepID=UPI001CA5FCC4|nr:bifunctional phosphoribosyl-AMP cyclohydrolase/phosphoribosyl-ATP diphosphatase HisIE [Crassaminicella profunda]QZY57233.1 bifunctional phosphoribosyl-AMP cyclohydrolase/phosphoribosyl-ATP diphosphatase HisIE [Crassaminicella profunda]
MENINLQFDGHGLIPAIVQDINTKKVLMMAYMNEESFQKTLETKKTWFYSRSRQKLWNKGETSGNYQIVKKMSYDCDGDTLLIEVIPLGNACHTGAESCFFNKIVEENEDDEKKQIVQKLYTLIKDRKESPKEGSYTNYLFEKGIDKILKKVGEEASEVIIGAKNDERDEIIYEVSDLIYHLLVLLVEKEIPLEDIKKELYSRYNK